MNEDADSEENIHLLTAAEANDEIAESNPAILDVRTPEEFEQGHIAGAVNLPLADINEKDALADIGGKDRPVLVYCTVGHRSAKACRELDRLGFKRIYDLAGGIDAWPFGVVK